MYSVRPIKLFAALLSKLAVCLNDIDINLVVASSASD